MYRSEDRELRMLCAVLINMDDLNLSDDVPSRLLNGTDTVEKQ
jgi:hypothetical protein